MFRKIILPTLLAAALSTVSSRATPIDNDFSQSLAPRDNKYNFNCSNAPGIKAGDPVTQADIVLNPNLPETGSDSKWFKYVWCTVGTNTYTFFNIGDATRAQKKYYNVYEGLHSAAVTAQTQVSAWGDGGLVLGSYSVRPPNTNVFVYARDSKGRMTRGILSSAMTGLANMAQNFDKANMPLVFQINDGGWGEVGVGVVGLLQNDGNGDNNCCYEITDSECKQCADLYHSRVEDLT